MAARMVDWAAPEMLEKIAKIPGLRDVTGDLYIKNPQMSLQIDREAAAVYGVTQDQIRQELYDCFGNRQVASMYTAVNDYYVILECDPKIQANPVGLSKLFLKTNLNGQAAAGGGAPAAGSGVSGATAPTGPVVPLSALIRQVPTIGALQINHQRQQPAMRFGNSAGAGEVLFRRRPARSAPCRIRCRISTICIRLSRNVGRTYLTKAFVEIREPKIRRSIVKLVEQIAGAEDQ